jgi:hypothetical protein
MLGQYYSKETKGCLESTRVVEAADEDIVDVGSHLAGIVIGGGGRRIQAAKDSIDHDEKSHETRSNDGDVGIAGEDDGRIGGEWTNANEDEEESDERNKETGRTEENDETFEDQFEDHTGANFLWTI